MQTTNTLKLLRDNFSATRALQEFLRALFQKQKIIGDFCGQKGGTPKMDNVFVRKQIEVFQPIVLYLSRDIQNV